MITEKVYSPINDGNIKKNLNGSPIWKNCYKEEDLNREVLSKHNIMYVYTIKFDGVTPKQVTKVDTL
jgi:hypothetical protein